MIARRFLLGLLISALIGSAAQAERVAYSFSGKTLSNCGTGGGCSLFGFTVPINTTVTGAFSYDTTTPGVDVATGQRTYHQYIDGGLSLSMKDGSNQPINVAASDYIITVSNNIGTSPIDQFIVEYRNYLIDPVPPPLKVNDSAWDLPKLSSIKLMFNWSSTTFSDPDEPKLTADRPTTSNSNVQWIVGSATSGSGTAARLFATGTTGFTIQALTSGDYNYDGKVDSDDYVKWRKCFGSSGASCTYADGNGDGVVDAADYVVLEHSIAIAAGSGASGPSGVPEPTCIRLGAVAISVALLVGRRSRNW